MTSVATTRALSRYTQTGNNPATLARSAVISLGALFGPFFVASCLAATLNVPSEYPTIQVAVDAAASGDSIAVAPGSYTELWIRIAGKTLQIVGAGRDETFLSSNPAVGFDIRSLAQVTVSGFDVTSPGGGTPSFIVVEAALYLESCRIHDSRGGGTGGGALATGLDANVFCTDVLFIGNTGIVGAVDVHLGNTAYFMRCRFENNVTTRNLNGAGAADVVARDVRFVDCDFIGNRSVANFGGLVGGLHISGEFGGSALVERCLFVGNEGTDCGALLAQDGGSATIRNCTIARNIGHRENSAVGVGLSGTTTQTLIENCIITDNGPTPALGCVAGALTVVCSDVWGNADDAVCPGGQNNLAADPQFCGSDRWDLQADSPCAPANNPTCGLIGVRDVACGVDTVSPSSWGRIKASWHDR